MPLNLTRTTDPTGEPLDVEAAKDFLKVSGTDDDDLISALIVGVTAQAEKYLGRALYTQTWTMFLDRWPTIRNNDWWDGSRDLAITELDGAAKWLEVPKAPLQTVTSIKTYDDADAPTTFAASGYFVDSSSAPGRIVLRAGQAAPFGTRVANAIEVIFIAGYGNQGDDVPEDILQGIRLMLAHLYENRGDMVKPNVAISAAGAAAMWPNDRVITL